jgi:hypothetical protein
MWRVRNININLLLISVSEARFSTGNNSGVKKHSRQQQLKALARGGQGRV